MRTYILLILSISFVFNSCVFADESWKKIINEGKQNIHGFNFEDGGSGKNTLIIQSFIGSKYKIINEIKQFIENQYDTILMDLYLSNKLESEEYTEELLKSLKKFHKKEQNSISCYYFSYYYAIQEDYELSLKYIDKGNKKNNLNFYNSKIKKLIYNFVLDNLNNDLLAYLFAINTIDTDKFLIFRRLSRIFDKQNLNDKQKDIILKFGLNIENSSQSVYGKLVGVGIQIDALNDDKQSKEYISLKKEHASLYNLMNIIEKKSGRDDLLCYLRAVYKNGEYDALRLLNQHGGGDS